MGRCQLVRGIHMSNTLLLETGNFHCHALMLNCAESGFASVVTLRHTACLTLHVMCANKPCCCSVHIYLCHVADHEACAVDMALALLPQH